MFDKNMANVSLLAAVIIYSQQAHSDDQLDLFSLTLEELTNVQVVTAVTGYEYSLNDAPASVTVIEAQEWEARGDTSLTQALTGVEGLQMTISSDSQWLPIIRGLGGTFSQQIKLLYDGIPLNNIHIGTVPALDIPLFNIKRIEIIRSPGSAVYGADAFGGIINLVPEDEVTGSNKAFAQAGTFDTYQASLTGSTSHDDVDFMYSITASWHGDNDSDRMLQSDIQTVFDGLFGTQASNAPGRFDMFQKKVALSAALTHKNTRVSAYNLEGEHAIGAGVAEALDPGTTPRQRHSLFNIKHTFWHSDKGDSQLQFWYQNTASFFPFNVFPAGAKLPIGADGNLDFVNPTTITEFTDGYIGHPGHRSYLSHLNYVQNHKLSNNHNLRWQIGIEKHKHHPTEKKNFGPGILDGSETVVDGTLYDVSNTEFAYLPRKERHFKYFSVQDRWQLDQNLVLHLGGRIDNYSDFGTTVNPRVGVIWDVDDFSFRLFSGSAFRAPTFYDQFAINNPVNIGNPELSPEKIVTNEFNIKFNGKQNWRASLTLYNYKARDLIEYVQDPSVSNFVAQNVGEIDGYGGELSIRWRYSDLIDIKANLSKSISKDANNQYRPNYAEDLASVFANYKLSDQLNFNIGAFYTGSQRRTALDTRAPLESSAWLKSNMSYRFLTLPLRINVTIENLTDEKYYTPSRQIPEDFPASGRQFLLSMQYVF